MRGNMALYIDYIRGADTNDRRRFDDGVIAYLSAVVDEGVFRTALESAADAVNKT